MKLITRFLTLFSFIIIGTNIFCQSDLDSVRYEIIGQIDVKTLYDQYNQENNSSDTLLSPWSYQLRVSYDPKKLFFVFECPDCYKDYEFNVLSLDSNNYRIERVVHWDSLDCCVLQPLLETSVRKRYQEIKSYDWDLITEIVDDGCQDTHYSNLQISNENGTIKFENLNNVRVYELDWYYESSSLLVVSTRFCRNELIIFKIE